MGISEPDVSNLLRGRFDGFSLERLLGFVRALGSDVEIKVKRRRDDEHREGRLSKIKNLDFCPFALEKWRSRSDVQRFVPALGSPADGSIQNNSGLPQ
jgi:hypothetical protein